MLKKWNFYIKVQVTAEEEEEIQPERLSREMVRQLEKIYGVRNAEVASITSE